MGCRRCRSDDHLVIQRDCLVSDGINLRSLAMRKGRFLARLGVLVALAAGAGCAGSGGGVSVHENKGEYGATLSAPGTDWDDLEIDVEGLRRERLASFATFAKIENPPEVDVVREVSATDAAQVKVDCMIAAGYPVRVSQEGVLLDGEVSDARAYNLQMYVCEAQYPTDPRVGLVLPRVRAEMQYEYLTQSVVPCLENLGFRPERAPSRQVWLDSYYGSSVNQWDPFTAASGSVMDLERAYDACPSLAPGLFP